MSRLIMKSLSKLQSGDTVSVTYGNVTHPETLSGTVTENETEYDASHNPTGGTLMLTDEAGQELFLSYSIIHGWKQVTSVSPAPAPAAAPTPVPAPAPIPEPKIEIMSLLRDEVSVAGLALSDRKIRDLFGQLPRKERKKLDATYSKFQYGVKCTDRERMSAAARAAYQLITQPQTPHQDGWSTDAACFCGALLARAGLYYADVFLVGRCFHEAALCAFREKTWSKAGAYAALSLLEPDTRHPEDSSEEDLLTILTVSALNAKDLSAVRLLDKRLGIAFQPNLRRVLAALVSSRPLPEAVNTQDTERTLSALAPYFPGTESVAEIRRFTVLEADEDVSGGVQLPEPSAISAPPERRYTGWISKLDWGSRRGEITAPDGRCYFAYQEVEKPLAQKLEENLNNRLEGPLLWVNFIPREGWAYEVRTTESPLVQARQAAARGEYENAIALCEQAALTPDAPNAMGDLVQFALEKFRMDRQTDTLYEVESFFRAHQDVYPQEPWRIAAVGQLYYGLCQFPVSREYLGQALQAGPISAKVRSTFLAQYIRSCIRSYYEKLDLSLMDDVRRSAQEWLDLYHSDELSGDEQNARFYPRILIWKCRAECALNMPDEAEEDLRLASEVLPPYDERLARSYAALEETRKRVSRNNRPDTNNVPVESNSFNEPAVSGEAVAEETPRDEDEFADENTDEEEYEDEEESESGDENMETVPYQDKDGWSALGLTKQDIVSRAMEFDGSDAVPLAVAYLKAASTLNDSLLPVYRIAAIAVSDPLMTCDYSISTLLNAFENMDTDYPRLTDFCMGAAFLRASFLSGRGWDFTARGLRDSISVVRDLPALQGACDTLDEFRNLSGQAMDIYADYRNQDVNRIRDELEEVVHHAEEVYRRFVLTPPREGVRFARLLETKKIAFAKENWLSTMIHHVMERDHAALEAEQDAFVERYLNGVPLFSHKQLSTDAVDEFIEDCWTQAAKRLRLQKEHTDLQGDRRNNLRSNITEMLDVICHWYALTGRNSGLIGRTPEGENAAANLHPRLSGQLEELAAYCQDTVVQVDNPEDRLGLRILGHTAQELSDRLEGRWSFEQENFFYVTFLKSDAILLDEDFLPDFSSTFCALPELNVLARIRAHAESELPDWQTRLDRIYGPDRTAHNYGTATRILDYLRATGHADAVNVPENAEQFVTQARLQAGVRFRSFLEAYALAMNYGQIMHSDNFCATLEDTVRYWYVNCLKSRNYGFFNRILTQAMDKIHESAQEYESLLGAQLDALISGNQEQFNQHPGYADAIREQITNQNFIVAEDWMRRIRVGDFSLDIQQPEALGYLEDFWNSYAAVYNKVSDASRSLGALLGGRRVRNKDMKGAQQLIDNWLNNGSPSSPERITQLLNRLGWNNIQVTAYRFPADPKTEIYYAKQDAEAANMTAPLHPIAAFGSRLAREGMYVACLYGSYDCDRLYEKIRSLDALDGNKVILLDYALGGVDRRVLARKIKQRESGLRNVYLVVDRVLLCHLANNYNENLINRILMADGIPFSYCQPYVVESSHTMPPEIFIGRKDELLRIEDPNGVNLIYGGRQLGKSALFKKARGDLDGNQGRRAVLVDIKDCDCAAAARRLSMELMELEILPDDGPAIDDWDELCDLIRRYLRRNEDVRYLLIMLDEADTFISDCSQYNYKPLVNLKNIQQVLPGRFKFALAGLHNIIRFNREVALGKNAVITQFSSLKITPFRTPEAQELLTAPLSYLGLSLPSRVTVSQILATVNYFPGLIQLYCQKLIESLRAPDYAGYDVKRTPPYIITDDHLRRVMADKEFMEQIREKFEITLRLDQDQGSCYYPLTLLIGWMYTDEPSRGGYTAGDILRHAKDLEIAPLRDLSEEQVDALLQELQDLNILRSVSQDTYLLASKNFRDLLGSDDQIFEKLSRMGEGNA